MFVSEVQGFYLQKCILFDFLQYLFVATKLGCIFLWLYLIIGYGWGNICLSVFPLICQCVTSGTLVWPKRSKATGHGANFHLFLFMQIILFILPKQPTGQTLAGYKHSNCVSVCACVTAQTHQELQVFTNWSHKAFLNICAQAATYLFMSICVLCVQSQQASNINNKSTFLNNQEAIDRPSLQCPFQR